MSNFFRQSEERYRVLFEESPVSLWEQDYSLIKRELDELKKNGVEDLHDYLGNSEGLLIKFANMIKVVDVNKASLELFKAKNREDIISNFYRIFTREAYDVLHEALISSFNGKTSYKSEIILKKLTGAIFNAKLDVSISPGYEKSWSRVLLSLADITDQKKMEKALIESESHYRELIGSISDIFFGLDKDLRYIYWNKASESFTGISSENAIGRSIYDLFPKIIETSIDKFYLKVLRDQQPDSILTTIKIDDKDYYFDISAYPSIKGLFVFVKDVTERKHIEMALREAEERYRELFENINSGVAVYEVKDNGRDFIFKDFNRAGERIDKMKKECLLGKSVFEMRPGIEKFGLIEVFRRVWETGEPSSHPLTFYKDNKISGWYENFVYKLPSGEIVAVFNNVTEKKISEEKIKTALKEKEALLRELYHRTKNNMQVITALMALHAARINDEQIKDIFKEMQNRIHAMALVHQKLYQSKNLSSINLKEYIRELIDLLIKSYNVTSNNISLDFEMEDFAVLIDIAIPCGLIFNELISNALKYAFPEETQGSINIRFNKTDEGIIDIFFSDNGIGVSKDFDFRRDGKMGLQNIFSLVEHQLQGEVIFDSGNGVSCSIKFMDRLYNERI